MIFFIFEDGKKKLEKVGSYSLFGNVINLQVVRLGNNKRDSLLLSFRDAKVCVFDKLYLNLK